MSPHRPTLTAASLALATLTTLMTSAGACASSVDASSIVAGADSGSDAIYGGGGSVVPTFGPDGAPGTGTGYGTSPGGPGGSGGSGGGHAYGADGSALSPCPRDAAAGGHHGDAHAGAEASLSEGGDGPSVPSCPDPPGAGDLVIEELMIASKSGGGDHGEWVEVESTRDCTLDLKGLYAEVPHGKSMTLASVTSDLLLPPRGYFLIADSSDPTLNDDLPGTLVVWGTGTGSDVLLNSGDTITLYTATATIDTLTYPNPTKMIEGASMEFPSDCDPALRTAWGNWQPAVASWTPGFFGTPSAPNTDVSCPVAPPPPSSPPSVSPCDG